MEQIIEQIHTFRYFITNCDEYDKLVKDHGQPFDVILGGDEVEVIYHTTLATKRIPCKV